MKKLNIENIQVFISSPQVKETGFIREHHLLR